MPRRKDIPASIVVDRYEILNDLMQMIRESNDRNLKIPGEKHKIRFNKRSIRLIYGMIEELIAKYLNMDISCSEFDENYSRKILVKPFGFLRLESYDSFERDEINHLTGEQYTKPHTRNYIAYIAIYWRREWNRRKAFIFDPPHEHVERLHELKMMALKNKDKAQLERVERYWKMLEPPIWKRRK